MNNFDSTYVISTLHDGDIMAGCVGALDGLLLLICTRTRKDACNV